MAETTDTNIQDFVHERFRRLDNKLDQLLLEQKTTNRRLSSIEERLTHSEKQENHNFGILNDRLDIGQLQLDNIGDRLARIESRLDLSDGDAEGNGEALRLGPPETE